MDESDDLTDLVADLEATVRELRAELDNREDRRGLFGMPAPPTPGDVLSFTSEYAIPTTIAILEANVRMLETLQRLLQAGNRGAGMTESGIDERASQMGHRTVSMLEQQLDAVQAAMERGALPEQEEPRQLIEDARRMNQDIADRVDESRRVADEGVDIDVESEFQAIKDDVENEDSQTGSNR